MTRRLTFTTLALLLMAGAAAGAQAQTRLSVGAVGGLDLTTVALDPSPDFDLDGKAVGHAAVLVEVRATDIVSVESRVGWIRTGITARDEEASIRANIDHVSIPVMLKLRMPRAGAAPYGLVGMEAGIKVRAKSVATLEGALGMEVEDPEFDASLRNSNLAINIGAGVEVPAGRGAMLFEALYSHGVRDLTSGMNPDDPAVRTRQFRASVGFRF